MNMKQPTLSEGQVWSCTKRRRRILATDRGYVLYSDGSDAHRECLVSTFLRWIRRFQATQDTNAHAS